MARTWSFGDVCLDLSLRFRFRLCQACEPRRGFVHGPIRPACLLSPHRVLSVPGCLPPASAVAHPQKPLVVHHHASVNWQSALDSMPISTAMPLVADLLDHFLACTEQELEQLSLDLYELERFASHGFEKNEMLWRGQMQTSLHSCGSQLGPCPCGCRRFAFHDDRLAQKELHGILIRLQGTLTCGNNVYPSFDMFTQPSWHC